MAKYSEHKTTCGKTVCMEQKKVYGLKLGASSWGNGGAMHYYASKEARDAEASAAHPMDYPTKYDIDAVVIDGETYFAPKKIHLIEAAESRSDSDVLLGRDDLLLAALLQNRLEPMAPHHVSAVRERLGYPTNNELLEMLRTGKRA